MAPGKRRRTRTRRGAFARGFNAVERRNTNVLWLEPNSHPNGNAYSDTRINPASHQTPQGVPRGTLTYAWMPNHPEVQSIVFMPRSR